MVACVFFHKGSRGSALSSALWDQQQVLREQHGVVSGEGQLGVKGRVCTRGWWAWNRLPSAMVMALRWKSSSRVWMMLSDIGFDF